MDLDSESSVIASAAAASPVSHEGARWNEAKQPASPRKLTRAVCMASFGLQNGFTPAEFSAAYRREDAQYHPDKVTHLGKELCKLAAAKTAELNAVHKFLRG
jgi:hypothetical protein